MERYIALKVALIRRRMTMVGLARKLGCTTTWVHKVVKGEHRSRKLETALAELLPEVVEAVPFPVREQD